MTSAEDEAPNLMADLAKLLKKHGAGAFSSLAFMLRDQQSMLELADILQHVSEGGKARSHTRSTERRNALRDLREQLRSDPSLLPPIVFFVVDEVLAGSSNLRLRDIQTTAEKFGVHITSTSRSKADALTKLLRDVLEFPASEQEKIISELVREGISNEDSLACWNLIIEENRRNSRE